MTTMRTPPKTCQVCPTSLTKVFYDARTRQGPWAYLCDDCFENLTSGRLGTGFGQKYEVQPNGTAVKVEG